jgi:protein TonB
MRRQSFQDESEEFGIGMVPRQRNRRNVHLSFAVFFATFLAFALTASMVAQGNGGSTPGQGPDAAAHGVYKVGGDVSAPVLIHSVEPQPTDKAREANVAGTVQVTIWVDVNGNPSHVHVTRGLYMGLDEKAVEAVRQYKYKPGMKDGKPVMVELNVEVKF